MLEAELDHDIYKNGMNILFRTDASHSIGHGHVMRCLTLANKLAINGANCTFVCREHAGHIAQKIEQAGHQCILLSVDPEVMHSSEGYTGWCGASITTDARETIDSIGDKSIDWLVVDHYELDARRESLLLPKVTSLLVIDDLANRAHDCDVLLDQTPDRKPSDYEMLVSDRTQILCGCHYALIRDEFIQTRSQALNNRYKHDIQTIMLSLGGADPDCTTLEILQVLERAPLPSQLQIDVIPGSRPEDQQAISLMASKSRHYIQIHENCHYMAELMLNADIAIGAAGGTSLERACLGLPSIMLQTAQNQSSVFSTFNKKNIAACIQCSSDLPEILRYIPAKLKSYATRSASLIDGRGSQRVVEVMLGGTIHSHYRLSPIEKSDKTFLIDILESQQDFPVTQELRNQVWQTAYDQIAVCLGIKKDEHIYGFLIFKYNKALTEVFMLFDQHMPTDDAELFAFFKTAELCGNVIPFTINSGLSEMDACLSEQRGDENPDSAVPISAERY